LGSYVGGNVIWDFERIVGSDGPVSQDACIFIGTPDMPVIFYVGYSDFYIFDGAAPRPVGGEIREWFYSQANVANLDQTRCVHDALRKLIYIYYPSGSSARANAGVSYHYPTKRWGRCDPPKLVWKAVPKWDSVTALPTPLLCMYETAGSRVFELNGTCGTSSLVFGSFGDGDTSFLVREVKPTWIDAPDTAHATFEIAQNLAGGYTTSGSASQDSNGAFDVLTDGHWHRISMTCVGDYELNKVGIIGSPMGTE
jgi:hypothetical protein